MDEPPEWLLSIASQLQTKDTSSFSIRELINHYTQLYLQHLQLVKTYKDFRESVKPKEELVNTSNASLRSSSAIDLHLQPLQQDKFQLEKQILALNEKHQNLHTTILDQEKLNRRLYTDLQKAQSTLNELQKKYNDSIFLLQAKDEAIQILQDEFTALQLELSTREKERDAFKLENQELLDRLHRQPLPPTSSSSTQKTNLYNDLSTSTTFNPSSSSFSPSSVSLQTDFTPSELITTKLSNLSLALKSPAVQHGLENSILETKPKPIQSHLTSTPWFGSTTTSIQEVRPSAFSNKKQERDPSMVPQSIIKTIRAHDEEAICLSISLDGEYLATGGSDRFVKFWRVPGMQPIATIATALSSVLALHFGPTSFVSASADNIVRLYQPFTPIPKLMHTFPGHVGKVTGLTMMEKETHLFSCSVDRTIKVWDLKKAYCIQTLFAFSHCLDLIKLDPNALNLVSTHYDGKLRRWDTMTGNLTHEVLVSKKEACVSVVMKDTHQVVTLSRDNLIRLVDFRSMQIIPLGSAYMKVGPTKMGISPGSNYISVGACDGSIFVWDLRTKDHLVLTGGHGSQVNYVQWHPLSGTSMFSIDKTGNLTIWGSSSTNTNTPTNTNTNTSSLI